MAIDALIFNDATGRPVARGVRGVRYIVPEAWSVHDAPKFSNQHQLLRFKAQWRTLPVAPAYGWLDTEGLLSDRTASFTGHGLRMIRISPLPRREYPGEPETYMPRGEINQVLADLIQDDSVILRRYLALLRQYGTLDWTRIIGYGFRVRAGSKWVAYDTRGFTLGGGRGRSRWSTNLKQQVVPPATVPHVAISHGYTLTTHGAVRKEAV